MLGIVHGYCRANHCRMRSVADNDGWDRVERLVTELQAIERWDADYLRSGYPEAYEMLAFVARRKRRVEILSHLVRLIPPLLIKEQRLRIVRKSSRTSQRPPKTTHFNNSKIGKAR